jgi:hypothetical protein
MPNFDIEYQVRRVDGAEQVLARELGRIDSVMQSRQPYLADAEQEHRDAAWTAYSAEVETVQEVIRTEISKAEEAREVVEAELANPRLTWTGPQLVESNAFQASVERDLAVYSLAELEPQMRAALAGTSSTQVLAWRDALNARHRALQGDGQSAPVSQEMRTALATWAARFDERVRDRPAVKRKLQDVDGRLHALRDGHQRRRNTTRPRYVEAEQARLVATGGYGSRVGSGRPLRNFNEAPSHEMVEQG